MLVNNAALTYFIPVRDYPINRWMRSWAVNFHAPFILSQLALEDMVPNGSGSIVNISSGAAIGPGRGPYADVPPNSGGTCYGAEKAALERFTQGLAQKYIVTGFLLHVCLHLKLYPLQVRFFIIWLLEWMTREVSILS